MKCQLLAPDEVENAEVLLLLLRAWRVLFINFVLLQYYLMLISNNQAAILYPPPE